LKLGTPRLTRGQEKKEKLENMNPKMRRWGERVKRMKLRRQMRWRMLSGSCRTSTLTCERVSPSMAILLKQSKLSRDKEKRTVKMWS
jgi:hypothetical protein